MSYSLDVNVILHAASALILRDGALMVRCPPLILRDAGYARSLY